MFAIREMLKAVHEGKIQDHTFVIQVGAGPGVVCLFWVVCVRSEMFDVCEDRHCGDFRSEMRRLEEGGRHGGAQMQDLGPQLCHTGGLSCLLV